MRIIMLGGRGSGRSQVIPQVVPLASLRYAVLTYGFSLSCEVYLIKWMNVIISISNHSYDLICYMVLSNVDQILGLIIMDMEKSQSEHHSNTTCYCYYYPEGYSSTSSLKKKERRILKELFGRDVFGKGTVWLA